MFNFYESSLLLLQRLSRSVAGSAFLERCRHFVLSAAWSGCSFVALRSSFSVFIHLLLGRPLGRFPSTSSVWLVFAMDVGSDRRTWPNHLRRFSRSFSRIVATPNLYLMSSFFTWSSLMTPAVQRSIVVSMTANFALSFAVAGQRSVPYIATGRITVR
ncbi:unnamed protein product [Caenorhabditis auriculariae]|uniref:Uncharacterized protein n=1 Tax=Caenorhabditis auriculariae TaxID=2777116 RepID=A0A8S1GRQ0_9PELO|nr:unnamed protein product [Caenorhabditis auriculariae]